MRNNNDDERVRQKPRCSDAGCPMEDKMVQWPIDKHKGIEQTKARLEKRVRDSGHAMWFRLVLFNKRTSTQLLLNRHLLATLLSLCRRCLPHLLTPHPKRTPHSQYPQCLTRSAPIRRVDRAHHRLFSSKTTTTCRKTSTRCSNNCRQTALASPTASLRTNCCFRSRKRAQLS